MNEQLRNEFSKLQADLSKHTSEHISHRDESTARIGKLEKLVAGLQSLKPELTVRKLESSEANEEDEKREKKSKIRIRTSQMKLSEVAKSPDFAQSAVDSNKMDV
jgi:hypothetical protein